MFYVFVPDIQTNMHPYMRQFWALGMLLLPMMGISQALYNGYIQDLATGEAIPFARVQILNQESETESDAFGQFILKRGPKPPVNAPLYRFFHNAIIWEGQNNLSLELFAVNGQRVLHSPNLGVQGCYLLPTLTQGIYLLRLSQTHDTRSFKVLSDGRQSYLVDRRAERYRSDPQPGFDTLRISKPGYYPREILLPRRDTLLTLSLLRGEYEELDYFLELIDPVAYEVLSTTPSRTHLGEVRSVKVIYHKDEDRMYYMNSKRHPLHYTFARDILNFNQGNTVFNLTQYRENPNRYLYPANLNYYPKLDKYVLHLVAANEMSCENLKVLYDKLLATSFLAGKLFLFANRPEYTACTEIPQIDPEELYQGQNYQGLNLAENYGYLTKVRLADLQTTFLSRREIVLLDGIPNDVSVVAGIITTEFQTPLAHINVLSHSRGTPNMALRDGWTNPRLDSLVGRLVYLKVNSDDFVIRAASLAEAEAFWQAREPQTPVVLAKNTGLSGLVELEQANHRYVDRIGSKAANFAELLKVRLNGQPIPTPEQSFAIPFFYYQKHLEAAGLDSYLPNLLQEEAFRSNPAYRRQKLSELQEAIKNQPLDPALTALVRARIQNFAQFAAFRFRSSSNAEDLGNFSGAGLYDSFSAKQGSSKKTIENAIRKVWASLWYWRAFEEREYYKIDHLSCAMGILVHRSFPDEDANGVVITRNLYNQNEGFIINVQYKEYSIVFPEPGIIHDQIMLIAWSVVPEQQFILEYLTFSNVPELMGQTVMSNEELQQLGDYVMAVKEYFFDEVPHGCNCPFPEFGLDIEFKVDSEVSPRQIYLKQVREYR